MNHEPSNSERENELDEVLADYLRRIDLGEEIDQLAFIAAHPEQASKLRAYFSHEVQMGGAPTAGTAEFAGKVTPGAGLEVRCPNCHEPTQVAVDTTLTDIICSACGSHFSLVDQNQATRMAPALTKLGRFELIERLGVGGFGTVWKARDKELDRTVAIKIPRAGCMTAEEQGKFFREARAAAQLKHPSIVSVHEVGRDGESVYIVSDFVRGVTLGDWLTGQQLTSREAAEMCAKIADALQHAHEHGVVHRDLKPANIMIDGDGQPHLMDFGLARRDVGEVTVTMDGHILGTPAYMSPEQAEGKGHQADRRSDVYSLGVVLFQLLTGELPFRGNPRMLMHQVIHDEPPSPRKLNGNVPKDLETITLKCLEKEPTKRFQTASELAEEIGRHLSGESIRARPIGPWQRTWRWSKRNSRVALLAASVAVLLVAVAALSLIGFAVARNKRIEAQEAAKREASLHAVAEENLDMAKQAADEYLTRVADDARLKQQDFHELRTKLLEAALPFYERIANQTPGSSTTEMDRAMAYKRLGEIHCEIGQFAASISEFEHAIGILDALATQHPETDEYQVELAARHSAVGWSLMLAGKRSEVQAHYDAALSIITKLSRKHPNDPGHRCAQALIQERYGLLLRNTDRNGAKQHLNSAVDIARDLVKEFPNSAEYQTLLGNSSFHLGHLLTFDSSEFAIAEEHINRAAEIRRAFVERNPKNPDLRSAFAENLSTLGIILGNKGRSSEATNSFQTAIETQKQVVSEFPTVASFRVVLAGIHWEYGVFLMHQGDIAGAVRECERFTQIYEQFADEFSEIPKYYSNAVVGHERIAELSEQQSDHDIQKVHLTKALALRAKIAAKFPSVRANQGRLIDDHIALGDLLSVHGEFAKAKAHYDEAVKIQPESADAMNSIAWLLATSPLAELRDGKRAVELATKACELTDFKSGSFIDTLAAAYAEMGDFDMAVKWSQRAVNLVGEGSDPQAHEQFVQSLTKYKAKQPMRQELPLKISDKLHDDPSTRTTSPPASDEGDGPDKSTEIGEQK